MGPILRRLATLESLARVGKAKVTKWPASIKLFALLCSGITAVTAFDHVWSSGTVLGPDDTRQIAAKEAITPNSAGGSERIYAIRGDWDVYLTAGDLSERMLATLRGKARVLFCVEGEHLYILGPDQKEHDTHVVKTISRWLAAGRPEPRSSQVAGYATETASGPAQPPQQPIGSVQRLNVRII